MSLSVAYALVGATSARELHRLYSAEDQRLMKSREWDYENPALLTNKIKAEIETVDLEEVSAEEREWCLEILWFWHHHAISWAIARHGDRARAQLHAHEALRYQCEGHPNRITRLLFLLVYDRLKDAEAWAGKIVDEVEKETAASILTQYRAGTFFIEHPSEAYLRAHRTLLQYKPLRGSLYAEKRAGGYWVFDYWRNSMLEEWLTHTIAEDLTKEEALALGAWIHPAHQ